VSEVGGSSSPLLSSAPPLPRHSIFSSIPSLLVPRRRSFCLCSPLLHASACSFPSLPLLLRYSSNPLARSSQLSSSTTRNRRASLILSSTRIPLLIITCVCSSSWNLFQCSDGEEASPKDQMILTNLHPRLSLFRQ
jgi:hypothetical protein